MKIAIVTGASRGIGNAIAKLLISKGYYVFGTYVSSEEKAKNFEKENSNKLTMIKCNVGDESQVNTFFKEFAKKYDSLDVLVNNVGIDLFGKIENYSTKDWDTMMNVNVKSTFIFSKKSIPLLEKSDNANIINVTSRSGILDEVAIEFVPYSVTKAAVNIFTVGLSRELKEKNIRVNAIVPPPTKTDMFGEAYTKKEETELIQKNALYYPDQISKFVLKIIEDKNINESFIDPRNF